MPSFLTLAYSAPKSVTAPKKMPPRMIQSSTGSQPKAAAWIRAGDRAGAGDRAELVAENHPAVGRHIVFAVVFGDGRGLGGRVDAPAAGDPAPVQRIGRDQAHRRNEDDHECVHGDIPSSHRIWPKLDARAKRNAKSPRLCPGVRFKTPCKDEGLPHIPNLQRGFRVTTLLAACWGGRSAAAGRKEPRPQNPDNGGKPGPDYAAALRTKRGVRPGCWQGITRTAPCVPSRTAGGFLCCGVPWGLVLRGCM